MRLPIVLDDIVNTSDFNEKVNESRRLKLTQELVGNNASINLIKDISDRLPEFIPGEASYSKNSERAANMSIVELYFAVRNKGEWDYKQLNRFGLYEDFGNSNFAAVTRANIYTPDWFAKLGAGVAQIRAGTSPLRKGDSGVSFKNFISDPNFGDDSKDQAQMKIMWEILDALDNIDHQNLDPVPTSDIRLDSSKSDARASEPNSDTNYNDGAVQPGTLP